MYFSTIILNQKQLFMKSFYKFSYLLLIPFAALLYANSSGSPGGRSGSPGDGGATCTACHAGTATAQSGWITTNIPDNGFTPGETYEVTLNAAHSGAGRFGFELTAENPVGNKLGGFTITDATRTKLIGGGNAVTHTSSGNSGGNNTSWSFSWTAPADEVEVRFYAAVNAANGNGNTAGDQIYTTNLFSNIALPAVLVSVDPSEAEKGTSPELTLIGANTNWTSETPVVSIINIENSAEVYTASTVSVVSDEELMAVIDIPFEATVGSYTVQAGDVSIPGAFEVTVVSSLLAQTAESFQMYPNPVSNDQLIVNTLQNSEVSIYDLNGRKALELTLIAGSNQIDVSALQAGMYVVVNEVETGRTTQKLIVR
jgi:hypothetical protein